MAEKKKTVKKTAKKTGKVSGRTSVVKNTYVESTFTKVFPYILVLLAVLTVFSFAVMDKMGTFGGLLCTFFRGMNGTACFIVPVLMIFSAIQWRRRTSQGRLPLMVLCQFGFLVFLSALMHVWTKGSPEYGPAVLWNDGKELRGAGVLGGIISNALISFLGSVGIHIVGLIAVLIFGVLSVGVTPSDIFNRIKEKAAEDKRLRMDAREQEEEYRKELRRQEEEYERTHPKAQKTREYSAETDKKRFSPDVDLGSGFSKKKDRKPGDDTPDFTQLTIDDPETVSDKNRLSGVFGTAKDKPSDLKEKPASEPEDDGIPPFADFETVARKGELPRTAAESVQADISPAVSAIFADPDAPTYPSPVDAIKADVNDTHGNGQLISDSELEMLNRFAAEQQENEAKKNAMMAEKDGAEFFEDSDEEDDVIIPLKEYVFPPISLLKYDLTPKNTDISEELSTNANKLVETLRSFKVDTKLVNVSRGPAITRYELQPKEGVRVKQIANLVDDIALNLATTGVRIEAPIPGKAAVGVEVPNKAVSTVYLRELVDTETFRKAVSKLNVALGVDVAGEPVYLDIAKMPHLLIAGATGMGKSVCINCIITSLLYKSTPEEVKMILIDPKKVEFDIYTGLPHLLVPVVSDPKKAAGALQWAVTEMERRFELIGSVGTRDMKGYNLAVADNPKKEKLCHIVIIIDELADLMMTAPDDVESSICRLAQKARAAGMHIIIGTQRPSVDVITGLIKANVPSRIAFTVASQTDSRVVLDMAGAEKLIGRGDMLYAPVGASKPRRVQGAFVSDTEAEAIVGFIKENNTDRGEYDSEIIDSIERNAAACGNKKGAASAAPSAEGAADGDHDPMLTKAIELAIESGKISTSLIQRRLALGYGRAAKLIDEMESMGIVSAPEGQKPRNVLITKQQYQEMFAVRAEDFT